MSLNPCEQLVFDYVQRHPEERQYWVDKVQKTSRSTDSDSAAVAQLEPELWAYFRERSGVVPAWGDFAQRSGLRRTSMKTLAEHWLRLWTAPRPKKQPSPPVA